MRRLLVCVVLLVAACSAPTSVVPPELRYCPPRPAKPAPPPAARTREQLAEFATREELAREAERARGDVCADHLAKVVHLLAH
jgi:hypothetical protein